MCHFFLGLYVFLFFLHHFQIILESWQDKTGAKERRRIASKSDADERWLKEITFKMNTERPLFQQRATAAVFRRPPEERVANNRLVDSVKSNLTRSSRRIRHISARTLEAANVHVIMSTVEEITFLQRSSGTHIVPID
jgi:hypothetical protein